VSGEELVPGFRWQRLDRWRARSEHIFI
jgi:hypothetical protein